MFTGSSIAAIAIPVLFIILDIYFVITLSFPRDERNQIIVWKASSFTLLAMVGANLLDVIENFVRAQPMSQNPFIQLEIAAIIYFGSLLYYRKRLGG